MIDFLAKHSGVIALVGFTLFFGTVAIWALWPANKKRFDKYKNIPFEN